MKADLPAKTGRRRANTSEQLRLRRAILKILPPVLQKLFQMAIEGDTQAAKLLLERALPPLSAVRDAIVLNGETPEEWHAELISKVVAGEIAPREALAVLELISQLPQGKRPKSITPAMLRKVTEAIYGNGE